MTATNLTNATITAPGSTASIAIGQRFNNTIPTVLDFGAIGDGVTDCSAAFTSALAASLVIRVPPGQYVLATPVNLVQGCMILGDRTDGTTTGTTASVILPTTAAFISPTPLTQLQQMTIDGLCFVGGTTQVDFGLCHLVKVTDCVFKGFSNCGLNIVRGEKQFLERLFFWFTANAPYGLGFGYKGSYFYTGGLYAGQVPATFFGSPDAWEDRAIVQNIWFQSDTSTTWTSSAIIARIVSNTTWNNIIFHGNPAGGQGTLFNAEVRAQVCTFMNIGADDINPTGATADGFVSPEVEQSTFIECHLQFAGNLIFTNTFNFTSQFDVTYINCSAAGDNISTFGFLVGAGVGQATTFVGCHGTIFSAGANNLVKGQINLVGCRFTTTNLPANVHQIDYNNVGVDTLIMADTNGAAAATASVKWNFATGSGGIATLFTVSPTGPVLRNLTVATLPTAGTIGRMAYCHDLCVFNGAGSRETTGNGTGGLVTDNGTAWKIAGTNVTASA